MILKIRKILNIALIVALGLLLPIELLYISFSRIQLTSKSFVRINEINNELEKLAPLENKIFHDKEELKYYVFKLINPNFFDKNHFLEYYLFDFKWGYQYVPNTKELEKAGIEETRLIELTRYFYFDKDTLSSIIKTINPKEDINVNTFIDKKNYEEYFINPLSGVLLPMNIITSLKSIKNISYKSTEEFEQAVRNVIGIEKFKQYKSFILAVVDKTAKWQKNMQLIFISLLIMLILIRIIIAVILGELKEKETEKEIEDNISKTKEEIEKNPNEIVVIWDLANLTLQKYYNKNISQVNSIYKLSITVMFMGFLLIVSILIASIFFDVELKLDSIGIIAGIITEFIGATFLFIYKSTIKQALQHSKSLEDINKVGMSIRIIEQINITDDNRNKIENAKLEIAKELISFHNKL